jgi:hypothetical protein
VPFLTSQLRIAARTAGIGWDVQGGVGAATTSYVVADEARETRGSYQDFRDSKAKTKTANNFIADTAYQCCLAAKAIYREERQLLTALASRQNVEAPWATHSFFPVIVTTANLFECEFDPSDVDPPTGTIPLSKPALRPVDEIVYEYPLPRHLQSAPADPVGSALSGSASHFWRMHILVVRSTAFATFLEHIGRPDAPRDA